MNVFICPKCRRTVDLDKASKAGFVALSPLEELVWGREEDKPLLHCGVEMLPFEEEHRPPDDDRPSWRTRKKRREADISFLSQLRAASHEELRQMLLMYEKGWQRVAIERRIRLEKA
jgi:hypothetical protein